MSSTTSSEEEEEEDSLSEDEDPIDVPHTPAPQESRGLYGFALFIIFNLLIVTYFIWLLLPNTSLEDLSYSPPQRYWGLAVPIVATTGLFLFAFCIYPALHGLHETDLGSPSSITDPHAVRIRPEDMKGIPVPLRIQRTLPRDIITRKVATLVKSKTWSVQSISPILPPRKSHSEVLLCTPVAPVGDMDMDLVCRNLYIYGGKRRGAPPRRRRHK